MSHRTTHIAPTYNTATNPCRTAVRQTTPQSTFENIFCDKREKVLFFAYICKTVERETVFLIFV